MSYKPVNLLVEMREWDLKFFQNMIASSKSFNLTVEQRLRVSEGFMQRFRELWENDFVSIDYPVWNKQKMEKYKPKPLTKMQRIMEILREKE
jgi:hypothetical protein